MPTTIPQTTFNYTTLHEAFSISFDNPTQLAREAFADKAQAIADAWYDRSYAHRNGHDTAAELANSRLNGLAQSYRAEVYEVDRFGMTA